MQKKIALIVKQAVAATFLLACLSTSAAAQGLRVTEAFLKADDGRMSGTCPIKVVFHGYITADGPGTVEYTFKRSDGATAPVSRMEFQKAGTLEVTTDWTLGDNRALPTYEGWQAIKILSPVELESSHETGAFLIKCAQGVSAAPPPSREEKASGQSGNIAVGEHPPDGGRLILRETEAQTAKERQDFASRLEREFAKLNEVVAPYRSAFMEAAQKDDRFAAYLGALKAEADRDPKGGTFPDRAMRLNEQNEPLLSETFSRANIDPDLIRSKNQSVENLLGHLLTSSSRMEGDRQPDPPPPPPPPPPPSELDITLSQVSPPCDYTPFPVAPERFHGGGRGWYYDVRCLPSERLVNWNHMINSLIQANGGGWDATLSHILTVPPGYSRAEITVNLNDCNVAVFVTAAAGGAMATAYAVVDVRDAAGSRVAYTEHAFAYLNATLAWHARAEYRENRTLHLSFAVPREGGNFVVRVTDRTYVAVMAGLLAVGDDRLEFTVAPVHVRLSR